MTNISPYTYSVTPIQIYKGDCRLGDASGFFYDSDGDVYLITNRHVVIDEKKEFYPDKLKIRIHTNNIVHTQNEFVDINLYEESKIPLWKEHPIKVKDSVNAERPIVDVVAIKLNLNQERNFMYLKFTTHDFPPIDMTLDIGSDLLVLGYPLGFYDHINNFPIARSATIASVPSVSFRQEGFFLIDANLHQGTSGSPVLTKLSSTHPMKGGIRFTLGENMYLVGVHSAGYMQLGLNVVWPSTVIEEIIKADNKK